MKNGQVERCAAGRALLSSRTAVWCSKKSFVRRQKGVDGREPELTLGGSSLGPSRGAAGLSRSVGLASGSGFFASVLHTLAPVGSFLGFQKTLPYRTEARTPLG